MTLDNSRDDLPFHATPGDVVATTSPHIDSSSPRYVFSHHPHWNVTPDSTPTVPSPLSQSTTTRQRTDDAPRSGIALEEWSTEVGRYGLSAAAAAKRQILFGDHTDRSTDDAGPSLAAPQLQKNKTRTPGKRILSEDSSYRDPPVRPPLKKARAGFPPPPRIDLSEFKTPALPPKLSITSPLFFSHKGRSVVVRPPGFSGSEAAETMLRSVKDPSAADVTTLKLARGTVSSASPARSSSTPGSGSWASIDATSYNRSPDALGGTPGLHFLHGVGILELLERDDRPTFVVDGANAANSAPGPFVILYANPALQASDCIRFVLPSDLLDEDAKNEFAVFKSWVKNPGGNQEGGLDVFLPSFYYAGLDWTCSIIRSRFRFVSANRSAASIARTSPEPQLERETSVDSRAQGHTPNPQPKTPSDIVIPDAPDYFTGVAGPTSDAPGSIGGSDGGDHLFLRRNSDFTSDLSSIPSEQPSFDWTRLPLTPDLPDHIQFARSRDWASTPLGPVEHWSADLRAMANMVMGSPHPAAMYWGPEYIAIYNEAYVPMAGQKHPQLMGQSYKVAWKEIWSEIEPIFLSAWHSGQATMKNDHRLILNRHGFDEETFFSWSIVPLVGDDGSVVGLYNPAFENTRRKVAERRMLTLRDVGEKTALARDVRSFWSQVQRGLELNEDDIPFALVYSVSDDSESDISSMHSGSLTNPPQLVLEASLGIPEGHPRLVSPLDLRTSTDGFAPYMRDSMSQAGVPIILSKDDGTLAGDLMDGFDFRGAATSCRSIVIFPIHPTTGGDSVVGFLVMGLNPQRPYDDDYQLFIHLLSRQLATSMASVVLFEEEIRRGQRAARLAALDRQELTKQLHLRTQEVEESELKFTRMAEFAPVAMFIANNEGLITYCNDMWWEITQRPRDNYFVDAWMDEVNDEDRPALEEAWQHLTKQKIAITIEFRFKRSREESGNVIDNWVLMSAYPENFADGSIKEIFGCMTNISQQKLAEQIQDQRRQEAVELKRQQENFIDITSHEMRNPLSAILQCADEISGLLGTYKSKKDFNLDVENLKVALEACREAANTITLCASHQKRIVDDILTLSKLDSQLLLVTPVDVQPVAVVQRVLKMFEGELNTSGIEMTFQVKNRYIDMGVDWVKLDPSRLLQVLINLMTNAIKFTNSRAERKIVVTLDSSKDIHERTDSHISFFPSDRPDKGEITDHPDWGTGEKINLHFSVRDTGRGLDEHEKKLLFQRFSQASPRTHVQYGGSGLGLFISRILTELQGGQIGVDSQKGVGSEFSFYVQSRKAEGPNDETLATAPPLTRAPGSSTTIENRQPPPISRVQAAKAQAVVKASIPPGKRAFDVLIVEDNLVNQKVLQRQLKNSGNNTQVANHGGEAIELLKKSRYWVGQELAGTDISVILMDLEMPVMDGMTCTRKIRELEQNGTIVGHIPIIAVTAYARPEQIEDAKAAGVALQLYSHYISKDQIVPTMSADLAFGPEGNQWVYNRDTKTYDLTRNGGSKRFTVSTAQGPPDTQITIDPRKTALIIVDMQNYFLDGKVRDHPTGLATVKPTLDLIHKCRKLDIQVIWLNWGLTDEDLATMPASVSRGFARSVIDPSHKPRRLGLGADLGNGLGRTLMAGEWSAAIYPPLAAAANSLDKHLPKNRMSGLWNEQTPLWRYLKQSGHQTLLFAGVNTDQCVLGTLTSAYNAGWDCVLVEDCCATTTQSGHHVSSFNVANSYGFVIDSQSFKSGKLE
ncbi:hypothetical protein SCARD494_11107 [Seiridium cardinale]